MSTQQRTYQNRSSGNRRTQFILLILAAIIVALVLLNHHRKKQLAQQAANPEPVLTPESTAPAVKTEPVPVQAPLSSLSQSCRLLCRLNPTRLLCPMGQAPRLRRLSSKRFWTKRRENYSCPDQFNRALDMKLSDAVRDEVKKQLTQLTQKWLFEKTVYPGDTLTELHKVGSGKSWRYWQKNTKCRTNVLRPSTASPSGTAAGRPVIKVVNGPFSAVITKKKLYHGFVFAGDVCQVVPCGAWQGRA